MTADRGDLPDGGTGGSTALEPSLPTSPEPTLLAPWSRRVVGALLDQAVLGAVTFLAFAVQPVEPPGYVPSTPTGPVAGTWVESGWVVATVTVMVLMQAYLGSTPGKLAVGLAVVHERDGRPVGALRTLGRCLAHLLDSILLIGYLRPLWHAERRTFADSLAGTVVLHTRRPLPHRALAGGVVVDHAAVGGDLRSADAPLWEADRQPRWRRPATVAAVGLCVAAVALMAGETRSGAWVGSESCSVAGATRPRSFAGGSLHVRPGEAVVSRLGVKRRVLEADPGVVVRWDWTTWPVDDAVLEVTVARADGTGARTLTHVLRDGVVEPGPGTPLQDGSTGVELPSATVDDLGPDWTWALRATVDGVTSPDCVPT